MSNVGETARLRTLGIIPARRGSKRLPRKNIRQLGGKPLVAWSIEAGRDSHRLDRLVVSSDDVDVLQIAYEYDPRLVLERPASLCGDDSPAIDYVRHALDVLEQDGDLHFEAVAIIQPSSPFTLAADIDGTIDLLERVHADSAVTIMKLDHAIHPFKIKTLVGDRLLAFSEEERDRMMAKDLPELYVRNCSVYATTRATVDSGRVIGEDCRGLVMPRERSLDINELMDLNFAEFLLARNNANTGL